MIALKNKHKGLDALIIYGGPSVIVNYLALDKIKTDKYVTFLESKALTPYFLKTEIMPDYYLMFYPEKSKSNSFQNVIFQSFLADIDLSGLIKEEYLEEYNYLKNNFNKYFESYRPWKSLHKKYRIKPNIYLKNSPFDLLYKLKEMSIITYLTPFNACEDHYNYSNKLYKYDMEKGKKKFDLEDYFLPVEKNGMLFIKDYSFLNSSAIALFPILKYMGFQKVYFIGMDMSMMGSFEYASNFTFRSMRHFGKFFNNATKAFSASFKKNRKKFMRPPYEFKNQGKIFKYDKMEFINIFEPFKYALPVRGIKNITFKEFLNE